VGHHPHILSLGMLKALVGYGLGWTHRVNTAAEIKVSCRVESRTAVSGPDRINIRTREPHEVIFSDGYGGSWFCDVKRAASNKHLVFLSRRQRLAGTR
jgi:hypothetical protein